METGLLHLQSTNNYPSATTTTASSSSASASREKIEECDNNEHLLVKDSSNSLYNHQQWYIVQFILSSWLLSNMWGT